MTTTATAPGVAVTGTVADLVGASATPSAGPGRSVGVVLTMGALHDGHASLIARAAAECDVVAVSVFVNPTQFAEPGDLTNYPRTLEADLEVAGRAGADLVFAPSVAEMYPDWPTPPATTVTVRGLGDRWEGLSRPGHFDGVATVVAKLLSMAGRCRTYFGEKDFQQLAIVRRVVRDLSLPVEVVGCPTVREPDGLAMSSRNVRLVRRGAGRRRLPVPGPGRRRRRLRRRGRPDRRRGGHGRGGRRPSPWSPSTTPCWSTPTTSSRPTARTGADGRPAACGSSIAAQVGPVRLIDNLDPRAAR